MDFDFVMSVIDEFRKDLLFLESEYGTDRFVTQSLELLDELKHQLIDRHYNYLRDQALRIYCK